MRKTHTYLTVPWLVFLACIPPIKFLISMPRNDYWFILILIAGFFGLYTLFIRTDWKIKVVAISSFFLCFFSASFSISFTTYISIILACYLYINCLKIECWKTIFKVLQTIMFLNILLMGVQYFGKDSLLNWSLGTDITCFGAIGYHMQMGSFSVILSAMLLPFSLGNLWFPFVTAVFCGSSWTMLSAGMGVIYLISRRYKTLAAIIALIITLVFSLWAIRQDKFRSNMAENGRIGTWEKSLHYALQKPLTGWGPGTYKVIFPPLDRDIRDDKPYSTAHNWIIELLFEMGIPFTLFVIWWLGDLAYRLMRARENVLVAGLIMMGTDGLVHFPDRMIQCVGIIICFLAYCESRLVGSQVK